MKYQLLRLRKKKKGYESCAVNYNQDFETYNLAEVQTQQADLSASFPKETYIILPIPE